MGGPPLLMHLHREPPSPPSANFEGFFENIKNIHMSSFQKYLNKKCTFGCTIPTKGPPFLPILDLANFSWAWRLVAIGNQWNLIKNAVWTYWFDFEAFVDDNWVAYEVMRSDLALQDRIVSGSFAGMLLKLRFEEWVCTCGKHRCLFTYKAPRWQLKDR